MPDMEWYWAAKPEDTLTVELTRAEVGAIAYAVTQQNLELEEMIDCLRLLEKLCVHPVRLKVE